MYIKRICFPVTVLGPGKRVGIWFAGCNKNCIGCMSPELQTRDGCKVQSIDEIKVLLSKITAQIDGVTISGGEPFLQHEELYELVLHIRKKITKDIIVYTGFNYDELKEMGIDTINGIIENISVLIDGEYIDELNDGKGLKGSSNQTIHIFENDDKYINLNQQDRTLQVFRYGEKVLVVGIQ